MGMRDNHCDRSAARTVQRDGLRLQSPIALLAADYGGEAEAYPANIDAIWPSEVAHSRDFESVAQDMAVALRRTSHDAAIPDGRVGSNCHIADNRGTGGDKCAAGDVRLAAEQGHDALMP